MSDTKKVLIVEDDEGILEFEKLELEHEGFNVTTALDGRQALEKFEAENPDLILLDVMLPELNGIEVLRRIRKSSNVPVIMVTARSETYDKVNGLDSGADDYITKPFEIEELLARIRTIMRRMEKISSSTAETSILQIRKLSLNPQTLDVILDGTKLSLSQTEYLLLKCLMENKDTVLSRDEIINVVWGKEYFIDENSVDVYVRYLRAKIDEPAGEKYIYTVRGAGYVIRTEETK
ncbi:MAG: response regulator transcription factor [Treponema sp.]|nr:response regulator transcription factor [Treponema sp.]